MTTDLERAYRAATYRVFLPGGALDLRVDEANPALVSWLAEHGVATWAILTAANPASRRLSDRENAERQAKLEIGLLEEGLEPYAGENISPGGDWPAEESCFVPGISLSAAMALAEQFGQNAILFGDVNSMPRLVWTGNRERAGE